MARRNDPRAPRRAGRRAARTLAFFVAGLAASLHGAPRAQEPADASFADHALRVGGEAFADFTREEIAHEQIRAAWRGRVGSAELRVSLWLYPRSEFGIDEPEDVADMIVFNRGRRGEAAFDFAHREFVAGRFGFVSYGLAARHADEQRSEHHLFGVLEEHGYQLVAECTPPADEKAAERITAVLREAIAYDGPERDDRWSDDEARRRWVEHAPADVHDQLRIRRTDHYVILSNAGGDLFAKKMEECYDAIQKVFPFAEVRGRRLMPVFVFRTADQYVAYYSKIAGITPEEAARSKGHAWRDYYATYYESPNDPVHVHEATHQIFRNRLGLGGGGSWFQEGVAEYMSENRNEIRSVVRNQLKNDEHVPLKQLMVVPSLLGSLRGDSRRGGSNAGNAYTQAASLIAFLRESRFGKKRFQEFVHAIGALPRGDLKAIEREIRRIYEVDVDGLEAEWRKHWGR